MRNTETETSAAHPLIGRKQTGSRCAIIAGTRIRVADIVQLRDIYSTSARIQEQYPHLTVEQVDAALDYYEHNRAEIDTFIAEEDAIHEEQQRRQRESI